MGSWFSKRDSTHRNNSFVTYGGTFVSLLNNQRIFSFNQKKNLKAKKKFKKVNVFFKQNTCMLCYASDLDVFLVLNKTYFFDCKCLFFFCIFFSFGCDFFSF